MKVTSAYLGGHRVVRSVGRSDWPETFGFGSVGRSFRPARRREFSKMAKRLPPTGFGGAQEGGRVFRPKESFAALRAAGRSIGCAESETRDFIIVGRSADTQSLYSTSRRLVRRREVESYLCVSGAALRWVSRSEDPTGLSWSDSGRSVGRSDPQRGGNPRKWKRMAPERGPALHVVGPKRVGRSGVLSRKRVISFFGVGLGRYTQS